MHFRASGAYDAVQGLSHLFNMRLQNDDVQVFDVRWDQELIFSQWATYRYGPGRIVQVKIAGFCAASDCIGFVRTRNFSKQRTTELFKIEDSCEASCWSSDESTELQSSKRNYWKRNGNQESKRKKPTLKGKWENAFSGRQLDNVRKETHVVSVMIQHLETDARLKDRKDSNPLPYLIRRQGLTVKKNFRQKRTKFFGCEMQNSVPLQIL